MALYYVTFTGTLPGCEGVSYTFTPANWVVAPSEGLSFPPKPIRGTLTDDGQGNGVFGSLDITGSPEGVALLATDNADGSVTGWTWTLQLEGIDSDDESPIVFSAPAGGATGVTLDLSEVTPVEAVTAVTPLLTKAVADTTYFPLSTTLSLANDNYKTLFQFQVNGGTDATSPFAYATGNQTYGTGGVYIVGPATWWGYNVQTLTGAGLNANGTAGMSMFGDAGDTNNGAGGHGIECNPAFFITANGSKSTNALEMVAVNDNTNTVNTTIRCGTGDSNGTTSNIYFQTGDAAITFAVMSHDLGQTNFQAPVTFSGGIAGPLSQSMSTAVSNSFTSTASTATVSISAQGASSAAQFAVRSSSATASFIMSGDNSNTVHASMYFQKSGVNKWGIQYEDPYLLISNYVNGGGASHAYFIAGATYPAAATWFLSQLQCYDSMIVGYQALATTATTGFLYIPSCPGIPTGTPATQAGTIPIVYDSTDNRLYIREGGAWHYIALTA